MIGRSLGWLAVLHREKKKRGTAKAKTKTPAKNATGPSYRCNATSMNGIAMKNKPDAANRQDTARNIFERLNAIIAQAG
jgi:hypothetical protein